MIVQCRKYDIEQESRTLYGEDLKSVIERFRRTPEYLSILNDEVAELQKQLDKVSDRTTYAFIAKLYDRVIQEMGVNQSLLRFRSEDIFHRMGMLSSRKPSHKPHISRHGANKIMEQKIKFFDLYDMFRYPLSLAERNRMKDLGFEYCGLAIHAMMENMSPDDALSASTLLPHGGHQHDTTTQRHDHEMTKPTPSAESETTSTHHLFR